MAKTKLVLEYSGSSGLSVTEATAYETFQAELQHIEGNEVGFIAFPQEETAPFEATFFKRGE